MRLATEKSSAASGKSSSAVMYPSDDGVGVGSRSCCCSFQNSFSMSSRLGISSLGMFGRLNLDFGASRFSASSGLYISLEPSSLDCF
nr:hypothetical protein Iba_scaffold15270CG0010 [Ipomoea batatas]